MTASPELLTVADVAALLSISENAVRIMIARGQLAGVVRLGRRVRVRAADLRASLGLAKGSGVGKTL